jgi:predicted nucleic-acid-binding Zn-ribbon protein
MNREACPKCGCEQFGLLAGSREPDEDVEVVVFCDKCRHRMTFESFGKDEESE